MNSIRAIQELNKRELENNVSTSASWHTDYRDTAYIYIGGLPLALSEGDILTIFSQYGEPTYVNLVRDKENGKSKGFAFLKYEDQRSCDLAVDNLGGATIMGRVLKVDHTRYKRKDEEEEEEREKALRQAENAKVDTSEDEVKKRSLLREEVELQKLLLNHDDDDPMKEYMVNEKKEEVARAVAALERGEGRERKHRHRHHHRSRRDRDRDTDGEDDRDRRRHKHHHHSHRRHTKSP